MGFEGILGHERAVGLLRQALRADRLAHAYLFVGPEGVGKRRVALALAQAANCLRPPPEGDACGSCAACRKVAAGSHPDVLHLTPDEGTLRIDRVRALREEVGRRPYEGRRRFALLDPAEALTEQAQNALLKILEEPPGSTTFILLAGRAETLLPTVVSRCQRLAFGSVSEALIARHLAGAGVAADRAAALAALARGSVGKALALAGGALLENRDALVGRLFPALERGPAACVELAEEIARDREDLGEALELLLTWCRDLVVTAVLGHPRLVVNRDRADALAGAAGRFRVGALTKSVAAVGAAREALEANANPRLTCEALLFRLRDLLVPAPGGDGNATRREGELRRPGA
ncbi:MAG TPA: DNA polymerase III subunit delta' [Candidatus Methylomirabilis sp.]|jgi:DNA polymerase-3 subunit delta'|nr:DNA polymerase III subunit delta' [Candidatus Methylomirabilis sp.]